MTALATAKTRNSSRKRANGVWGSLMADGRITLSKGVGQSA